MVKKIWEACRCQKFWLAVLLFTNLISGLFLWLMDAKSFQVLCFLFVIISILVFIVAVIYSYKKEEQTEKLYLKFLKQPDKLYELELLKNISPGGHRRIKATGEKLRENETILNEQIVKLHDYEDYIESWVHEVKTPLSLLTLLLDNRSREMSPAVYRRLEHICRQTQEYVDQILYYARLRAVHKDYIFRKIMLSKCCEEVLDEYRIILKEKGFKVCFLVPDVEVVTDERGFCFILRQVVSNAVKYAGDAKKKPALLMEAAADGDSIVLSVRDNGAGVRECDLPFIFEKGFTGEPEGEKKKSTGMGLYLVKQMADDLKIQVDAQSNPGEGFEVRFIFRFVVTFKNKQRVSGYEYYNSGYIEASVLEPGQGGSRGGGS